MSKRKPASTPAAPQSELLFSMNAAQVAEALQAAGCTATTVEHEGVQRLHGTNQGVGFQVLWGNALGAGEYVDLTLSCALRVEGGTLPDGVLAEWHRLQRFARLARHGEFVALEMDVLAVGGVSPGHLAAMMQLWSEMMGQFFHYLRNFGTPSAHEGAAQAAEEAVAG